MKLRYLTVMNHVTAEQVKRFAEVNQLSLMQAKAHLEDKSPTRLQYLPDGGTALDWTDVPFVTEYRV